MKFLMKVLCNSNKESNYLFMFHPDRCSWIAWSVGLFVRLHFDNKTPARVC